MTKVYVGDIGTAIILDTAQALAGATSLTIQALKPDGTELTWSADVYETTKVRYVVPVGVFDAEGEWKLQAKVVLSTGTWLGETAKLKVYSRFN